MAPRVPKIEQPASFDPWVAIRPLDPKMQRALFALANQQLLDHVTRDRATSIVLSYTATLQYNVSHNLKYFRQSWFPSEHLRFTHGLCLVLELVDPHHQDQGLAGITWPAKSFTPKEPAEPIPPPAAKSKGKGKTGMKKTTKRGISPGAEESTSKRPRKPDSKVVVTGKSVAEAQYTAMYPHYRKKHLAAAHTSRAALSTVTTIIPNHERQALPVDDSGPFYVLPFNAITTAVGGSVPTDGPQCTGCQLAGSVLASTATTIIPPQLEFTFSDEILNNLGPERALWFNMSAPGWWRTAEDLEVASETYALAQKARDSAEKEMRFKALVLLHRIVCARAEMKRDTFVARFSGETMETQTVRMEYYLRLAMLLVPIPGFIDAYDFYDAFNQERARNHNFNRLGYFLVPKLEKREQQNGLKSKSPSDLVTITLSNGTTLHCRVSGSHARNRFMREVFE
ncbi:hypothetical protein B0H14DRAFT_2610748 [Mycena olivaceomarginata]|nr:hypothetical protein B0H14DRAFT_2610748 [Mycena olivaceomarginata]